MKRLASVRGSPRRDGGGSSMPGKSERTTDVRASYRECRRIVRAGRPTEYALIQLMPPQLRPAGWAMYAAFFTADDLIDEGEGSAGERVRRLETWVRALRADVARGASEDLVRRALVDTVLRWDVHLEALEGSLIALGQDAEGPGRVATWADWRARVQAQNTSWVGQSMWLLERAGVPTPGRLKQLAGFSRFLDGMYLTDTLADLADDIARGVVALPDELLDLFPGAEADLLARRWTPPVRELLGHLLSQARRWLRVGHSELGHQFHPGAKIFLETVAEFFMARLNAVEQGGRAVLRRPSHPGLLARWRILGPARIKFFLLRRLVPAPGVPDLAQASPPVSAAPGSTAEAPAPRPVPPHTSGARPPALARTHLPQHVAIIMDGNGRWAAGRGLPRGDGHQAGLTALWDVIYGALEIGLPQLTVYTFSSENWKRPVEEVSQLFQTIQDELAAGRLLNYDLQLRWIGDEQGLPTELVQLLLDHERATRTRTGLVLNLCLNYGGRIELAHATTAAVRAALAGTLEPEAAVSPRDFVRFLPYAGLPDVDLLWRTGGERRISNFLPWHITYAELHFTDTPWPDVDRRDLWSAVTEYGRRMRRYGAAPNRESS
ncbi:polyprenyl diphosphate synthase [Streptomyces sp. NPDC015346]|uniref:polyprenyl diphosphate synthase n=1 Tax=Streptomyces sp. NPDC015346 TaxID=3364954 RepID=UPI0036F9867D